MAKHWADFQYEIYLNGMTGAIPRLPTDLTRLEELTERRLGPGPVGYVAGSAGDGSTARANRAALERRRIVPRMLRDVHERDLSVEGEVALDLVEERGHRVADADRDPGGHPVAD
ncbi:alpha-hydroxy-acid oxidizing protein, partial [Streptomyces sp. NPDC003362]